MEWYERDSLPLNIKGLSESAKVCIWINLYILRLVEQLTFLQVRSDNRTRFFKVQIKTYHVCITATTENAQYVQNGIHGNHKFDSQFQYNIS